MKRKSTQQKKKKKKQTIQSKQLSQKAYDNTYSLDAYREQKTRTYINPYAKPASSITPGNNRNYTNPYQNQYKQNYTNPYTNKPNEQPYRNPYTNPYNSTPIGKNNTEAESNGYYANRPRKVIKEPRRLSRKEVEALKKKKKRAYKRRMLLVIFSVIVGVYGIVKMVDLFTYADISYQTVKLGMIDNSTKSEGIIIRGEKVYTSNVTGNVHYLTDEGEKVKKQGEVCYIADDNVVTSKMQKVEDIDKSIYNIQDKRQNLSQYQTEVNTLNKGIKNEMSEFYKNRDIKNTQLIYLLRNQLDRAMQTRTNIYVNDTTDRIGSLQSDRMEVISSLKGSHQTVNSEAAGIVSYQIDGFEEVLGIEQLEKLNIKTYKDIISKNTNDTNAKSIVQALKGGPLYKLIKDDKWYIISYVEEEDSAKYEEGKSYDLYFDNLSIEKVSFKLLLKQEEDKKVKLVLETTEQMNTFLPYRTATFTIGKNKAQGLKIPLTAIVEKNLIEIPKDFVVTQSKNQGILRKIGEQTEFVPVNVQYIENEKTYVLQELDNLAALALGQTIQNPNNQTTYSVDKINTIQGIYTINGRYAKFKKVSVDMANADYAIVNESTSGLKAFDQIISNPKSIKEDQLLKYMNIQNE